MSDETNPPPLVPGDAADFLARHADTGSPSAEQLATLKVRLLNVMDADAKKVTQLPVKPRRSFLPPELLAVAAVLMLAVLAQLIYLATRPSSVEAGGVDAGGGTTAVIAAYRSGDVAGAQRLAASSCTDATCASMSAKLLRAMELAQRLDALNPTELRELAMLDASLSDGTQTELTVAVATRLEEHQKAAPVDTDKLFAEARALSRESKRAEALALLEQCLTVAPAHEACRALKAELAPTKSVEQFMAESAAERGLKNYERAIFRAEACVKTFPLAAPCYRELGSSYAAISARDRSVSDMERAKKYYQRFLELADPGDEHVPKVKAILDAAEDGSTPPEQLSGSSSAWFVTQIAAEKKQKNYDAAARLGEQCIAAFPNEPTCYRVLGTVYASIASRDQSAADMERAKKNYERFLELAPPNDEYVPKVEAILGVTGDEPTSGVLYVRAYQLQQSSPDAALKLFRNLLAATAPGSEWHEKAKARIAELEANKKSAARDVYLRGYQLKEHDPAEAAKLFREVMTMLPPDDVTYQKAKTRLVELELRSPGVSNPPEAIALRSGTRRTLKYVIPIQRVAVGDADILDVRTVGNDSIELRAVGRGKTTLLVWMSDGSRISHLVTLTK